MKRRYQEWIFAGMMILGVSGQNRVFGQADEQDPLPVVSRTSPAAKPRELKYPLRASISRGKTGR